MATVIESGIDYLTLHTAMWSELRPMTPGELMAAYLGYIGTSAPLAYMSTLGYEGYGDSHFFVGEREDGWLRRIAGAPAHHLFEYSFVTQDRPSRIDLQVTLVNTLPAVEIIQAHREEALIANMELPAPRRRLIQLIEDNKGGMTVYVGSRHSDAFGRIYSKHAKTPEARYEGAVRYEIQLGGDHARVYAEMLSRAGDGRERAIAHYVREWFLARGLVIPMPNLRDNWRPLDLLPPKSTEATTMEWLRVQVRPAIARLLRSVPTERILSAIGLDEGPDTVTGSVTTKEVS